MPEVEVLRRKIQGKIFEICYIIEAAIAVVVGIAVVILCARLFWDMIHNITSAETDELLVSILDTAMSLAIGVEFIKMLCKHTPQTVVEVLLFAIAKQLVVFHTTPVENLINVAAIAGLFAVRRFLIRSDDRMTGSFRKNRNKDAEAQKEKE